MPLNGDLNNQGLDNFNPVQSGGTWDNAGKIGKCYNSGGTGHIKLNNSITFDTNFSITAWVSVHTFTKSWMRLFGFYKNANEYMGLCVATDSEHKFGFHIYHAPTGTKTGLVDVYPIGMIENEWTHIAIVVKGTDVYWYKNGNLVYQKTMSQSHVCTYSSNSICNIYSGGNSILDCSVNDFRIYDHALSPREVKEISKGLVLHYTLSNGGGDNLLIGSPLHITASDLVISSSTDWTIPVRYYNGDTSCHNFSDGIDTVSLKASGNIGIAFIRKATDINLDSSSYYTLSCEAKCTKSGAGLDTGLSYYTTADTWVWRGGTNRKLFKSVNEWQKFSLTFKPDADTQYICYCFTVVGVTNGTDTFSIKNCKLEKGTIDTPWIPNPADPEYTKMGYNNNIEYDCSGFKNNGTKVGTLTYTTDTPKYWTSTYSTSGTYINCGKGAKVVDAITVNLWINCVAWNNPISCTESGGWNFESNNGYLQFPMYISGIGYVTAKSPNITTASLQNSGWHMLTGTYDRTSVKLYIDGILNATGTPPSTNNNIGYNTNNVIFIGGEAGSSNTTPVNSGYTGGISDVRIYATALSADDILELYHTPTTLTSNGVLMTSGEFSEA